MYSFDNNNNDYKYESIQHGYEVDYYEEVESDPIEISLEEMLELEDEIELEEMAEAI
jgi:hypothetical protein